MAWGGTQGVEDVSTPYRRPPVRTSEQVVCLALAGVIYLNQLVFGANRADLALAFVAVYAFALAGLVACAPWARRALPAIRGLAWPAGLFGLTLAVALWSLTPYAPGGPNPIWRSVDAWPAATLNRSAVWLEMLKLCGLACVFLIGAVVGTGDARAARFLRIMVVMGGVYSLWAFLQQVLAPETILGLKKSYHLDRLTASYLSANTAAACLGMLFILALTSLLDTIRHEGPSSPSTYERIVRREVWAMVAMAGSSVCLVLSGSRGAVAATALSVLVLLVWQSSSVGWRSWRPALAIAGLSAAALVVLSFFGAHLIGRLLQSGADLTDRRVIYATHWKAFLASPWMGYGLGSFDEVNLLRTDVANNAVLWNIRAAHDVYLQWLEEGGVLGAAPMFACVVSIIVTLIRATWRRRRMTSWLRGLSVAGLVLCLHGLTDYALQVPSIPVLWSCLLGVGFGLASPRLHRATALDGPA